MLSKGLFLILSALVAVWAQEAAADEESPIINLSDDLFIVNEAVPFSEAENSCLQAGGSLAGLEEKSAGNLVGLFFEKSAAAAALNGQSAFWMKSHAVDTYTPDCIQFSLGEKSAKPSNCAELRPVLCEKAARRAQATRHRRRVVNAPCGCADRFNCDICDYPSSKSSSSSSSSSSDACTCPDQECQRDYLNDMDFYTNYPVLSGPSQTWSYFENSDITANGGVLTTGCKGGFLDSRVYNITTDGQVDNPYSDHYKYFIYSNQAVTVPKAGSLVFEYLASTRTFRTEQNPFPDVLQSHAAGDDVRYASGVFQVFDPFVRGIFNPSADGLVFSFYLTNDRVYVGYERQNRYLDESVPFGSEPAAFNFLIPVKVRRNCDLHDLKIVVNYANRFVSWRLDGREVFRVNKVGYLLSRTFMLSDFGGAEQESFPETLSYGFGSMTLLDNYPACLRSDNCRSCKFPDLRQALVQTVINADNYINPVLGAPQPAVFWDEQGLEKNRLWGQGSETHIRRLAVYTEQCKC